MLERPEASYTKSIHASAKDEITFENVSHSFDGKTVLSDLTLGFVKNKITAVLGKSGSGKSTLLQIINGLLKPVEGTVRIFDNPIDYNNVFSLRLRIGYVVQQGGLFPHLTIAANIQLLGKIANMDAAAMQKRVKQLIDMVQLPPSYLGKYPHQLSGGEQQRVGICRAMFLNPPVLLMDEPFASLDYETKHTIYHHLQVIQQQEPRTIVLVTHDWEEALTLADEFIWIKKGIVIEQGDKQVLDQVKTSYMSDR